MNKLHISVFTLIVLACSILSCKKAKSPTQKQTILVTGLFSLTGNWSSLGINSKAAVQLAADDINAYLNSKGSNFNIAVSVADTKLDTTLAKSFFATAKSNGTHFIIGPQSSAELAALKPLADASNIIVVSQGSTAGSLAIPNDPIYRFCPSDAIEGDAMSKTIYKDGIRGLITVARNDAGNKGLQLSTGAEFTTLGGTISALDTYSTTTTNYSSVIASLKSEIIRFSAIHGITHTAVYLASFDECTELFKQAAAEPVLSQVSWYGGDGVALSTALTSDPAAAGFAISTKFFAPTFGLSGTYATRWQPISARIKAITGTDPDAFALVAYDAMWSIAHTVEAANGVNGDFAQLQTTFVQQTNANIGITGPNTLNAAGDRATGTFDYYGLVKQGSTYSWIITGKSE